MKVPSMDKKSKVLYFITEDWYFCSHRLALAKAAQSEGYEVAVLTRVNHHGDVIKNYGFNLIPINIDRGGINPIQELRTLFQVWRAYRAFRPDIVHHIALKPVLYGGLVLLVFSKIKSVNLLAGLGAIYSSDKLKARILRPFVGFLLRFLLSFSGSKVVVQNSEDRDVLVRHVGVPERNIVLIKGSGVDTRRYYPVPESGGKARLALVARLLWDKGIGEFIQAVKLLKQRGLSFEALLVGEPDVKNMASVTREQLQDWHDSGVVSWLGFREDVAEIWHQTHIAVLPSYREGLPKSLLEAAACGRPIVTTDTSGCKEIVQDGVNGFLVPVRDSIALADALGKLIVNPELRQSMGQAGRKLVEQQFSDEIIIAKTLKVYRDLV